MDEAESVVNCDEKVEKTFDAYGNRILLALRRIIRAVDIHSRKLNCDFNITVPQMICLNTLAENATDLTQSQLAKKVNLSISTVNGILDRLEMKKLISRQRDIADRRKVAIAITDKGRELLVAAPSLLQDTFVQGLQLLPELETAAIAFSLEKVVELMEAETIDASPLLTPTTNILEPTQENK